MKKLLSLLLAIVMLLSVLAMTGCEKKEDNEGKKSESSKEDPEDSDSGEKEKYEYIQENFNNKDEKTYEYLKELKDRDYKDSASLYEQLYGWKGTIFVASTRNGMEHEPVVDLTGADSQEYYVNFRLSGGTPGEKFQGKYVITFSDGSTKAGDIGDKKADSIITVMVGAEDYPAGNITIILFDNDGVVLGQNTADVKLPEAQKPAAGDALGITYEGVRIKLGAPVLPILNGLGDFLEMREENGYRYYRYGSVYIRSQLVGDTYCVERFWFLNVGAKTDEDITLFDTREKLEAAYGADSFVETDANGCDHYVIIKNGGRLEIKLAGSNSSRPAGTVDSVEYFVSAN